MELNELVERIQRWKQSQQDETEAGEIEQEAKEASPPPLPTKEIANEEVLEEETEKGVDDVKVSSEKEPTDSTQEVDVDDFEDDGESPEVKKEDEIE